MHPICKYEVPSLHGAGEIALHSKFQSFQGHFPRSKWGHDLQNLIRSAQTLDAPQMSI